MIYLAKQLGLSSKGAQPPWARQGRWPSAAERVAVRPDPGGEAAAGPSRPASPAA
ncbi:hypothetical protein SGRA_3416 [Saprospira grandis str. Lewin]|uniref:Uncharacterized protein n=1 Tax=Saprospira grandis (strain Lewin) TaxID=984262 RepID=H6L1R3_SAPGL|nr:hypothetical protein SGRA_3416 [Saprospira grandis str. Lewin]